MWPFPNQEKENTLLRHTTYKNHDSLSWVTFLDGTGGIFSIWKKQLPEFKLHYNVLVVELKEMDSPYTSLEDLNFDGVSNGLLRVLELNDIDESHFIGLSLGTVFIKSFASKFPNRVKSVVLAGAIVKIDYRIRFLFWVQNRVKNLFSHTSQFNFFTSLLLPYRNHKESRSFLREHAQQWDKDELLKWAHFTKKLNPVLRYLYSEQTEVPSLYIMGEEDRLFLPSVKKIASSKSDSLLFIIQECGHIANMEQAVLFNKMVIGYLVGLDGIPLTNKSDLEVHSKYSPEEVLIANSNNHSKK